MAGKIYEIWNYNEQDNIKPTVTTKTTFLIATGFVEVAFYGKQTVVGSPNTEVIINAQTGRVDAKAIVYLGILKVTKGENSLSIGGKGASIGIKGDNISLDMNILKWGNSGCGFSISIDYRLFFIPAAIYYPQPVLQMIRR